jgi:protein-S-isoprenylcysteine O-methyltransferase Ste14
MDAKHAEHAEVANVAVRPPVLFLAAMLSGAALHWLWPAPLTQSFEATNLLAWGGRGLVLLALGLFVWAAGEFRRARTPIPTWLPTERIVTSGPYRFSRNPIYGSFLLLHAGFALWVGSRWLLLTLVAAAVLLRYLVVRREEAYLARRFPGEYGSYLANVRRWV